MQKRNVFAGPYLDRAAHQRQDGQWFDAAVADRRSRAIPMWNSRSLVTEGSEPRAVYVELASVPLHRRGTGSRGGATGRPAINGVVGVKSVKLFIFARGAG